MSNSSVLRSLVIKPKVRFTEPSFESPILGQKLQPEPLFPESNPPAASLPTPLSILRSTRGASASKLPPPGSFSLQTEYKSSEVLHPHLGLNIVKKGNFEYRSKEQDTSGMNSSRLRNSRSTMNLSSSPSGLLRKEADKPAPRQTQTAQGPFLNVYLNPSQPGDWQLKGVTARAQQELKKKLAPSNPGKVGQGQPPALRRAQNGLRQGIETAELKTLKGTQRLSSTMYYLNEPSENDHPGKAKDKSATLGEKSKISAAKDADRRKDAYRGHVSRLLQGRSVSRGVSREVVMAPKAPSPEQPKPQPTILPPAPKPVNMKQQQTRCFNLMNSRNPRHASYFSSVVWIFIEDSRGFQR